VLRVAAFGCRSVVPPEGAVITRHGDDVAVVCNQSLEVFYVTCSADDVWVGELGNCSRMGKKIPQIIDKNLQKYPTSSLTLKPGFHYPS